jgi:phosphohistidine swiveling domain-containing protein
LQFRDALGFLGLVVQSWYTGDNPLVFAGLITGSTTPTDTQKENAALWRLSDRVRQSPILRTILEDNEDPLFFAALDESAEGRDFLAEYRGWAAQFAHRGHADRDMLYPSRADDPAIDARTLRMLVRLDDSHDPEIKEHEANARRQAAHDEVVRNLRGQPFGFAKAEVFTFVFELAHKWIAYRDNERQSPNDFVRHSIRRGFVEMGRRLHERGILREPDDFHHLSFLELYRLFDGDNINLDLFRAKVAARRRDVDRMLEGQRPPKLLRRNRAYADAATDELGGDYLQGHSTNPGIVTAIARVVPRVAELGKVQPGDILVTHATDPGWTPVFLVISGIVTETGGLVSHASCLAREYGLPAVQLEDAMQHIPDGATIELNANTGQITVVN